MDYRILRQKEDLDSTGYIEIGPGKYSGKHWQEGFLFVWEDAFGMAEGILTKHFPDYDHFSMNDLPKDVGLEIAKEWYEVAVHLPHMGVDEAQSALNILSTFGSRLEQEVMLYKAEISGMLKELSCAVEEFYEKDEWVCILGI